MSHELLIYCCTCRPICGWFRFVGTECHCHALLVCRVRLFCFWIQRDV